jgi:hypothetical protein
MIESGSQGYARKNLKLPAKMSFMIKNTRPGTSVRINKKKTITAVFPKK